MATATVVLDPSAGPGPSSVYDSVPHHGSGYITPWRPWLTMYGLRVRSSGAKEQVSCPCVVP